MDDSFYVAKFIWKFQIGIGNKLFQAIYEIFETLITGLTHIYFSSLSRFVRIFIEIIYLKMNLFEYFTKIYQIYRIPHRKFVTNLKRAQDMTNS